MTGVDLSKFGAPLSGALAKKAAAAPPPPASIAKATAGSPGRQWYCLVRLEADGENGHICTESETAALARELHEALLTPPLEEVFCEPPEHSLDDLLGFGAADAGVDPNLELPPLDLPVPEPAAMRPALHAPPPTRNRNNPPPTPSPPPSPPPTQPRAPPAPRAAPQPSKPGGPCDHCGALESPQWRRGPSSKPMLCNACGTRYRRTNQLGPPCPSSALARVQPNGSRRGSPSSSSSGSKGRKGADKDGKRSAPDSPTSVLPEGKKARA
mmetsp:Transcript_19334/g.65712  ORF Transcript_19334/g.65712 Transcript_19334/m.65712 type:complete len:269 (-) Transcript_19334:96-902(-)